MYLGNFLILLLVLISFLIISLADLPRVMEALKKADDFLEQTLVDKCKARVCKLYIINSISLCETVTIVWLIYFSHFISLLDLPSIALHRSFGGPNCFRYLGWG